MSPTQFGNELELSELWVSSPLTEAAQEQAHLEVVGMPRPLPFDDGGNLMQEELSPHGVRGRRKRGE
jgi:hypothetical protein